MHGVTKMTMWKGKSIAGLKGSDLAQFQQDMEKMGSRKAFAPAMPIKPERPAQAKTNLRGK
jgi:hypothetical protein